MFPPKKKPFNGPTKKSPIIPPDIMDKGMQMGDAEPTPAKTGPTKAGSQGQTAPRGPRKFRRNSLTRVPHDAFMGGMPDDSQE